MMEKQFSKFFFIIPNLVIHLSQLNYAKWRAASTVTGRPPNFIIGENPRQDVQVPYSQIGNIVLSFLYV